MKKLFRKPTKDDDAAEKQKAASRPSHLPPYYQQEIGDNLGQDMRDILHTYSGVSEEEMVDHLHAARDKAWAASPYPCVGGWSFLKPRLRSHSIYSEILENARSASPGTYLVCDVGTGMGQELRCLAADGVPAQNLCAIDLNDSLWKCGFDLFRDKDKMSGAVFQAGSILEISRKPLASWKGTLDVMIAGLMLHCFDFDGQVLAAKNLAALAKKKKGSLIVGWQLGGQAMHIQSPRSRNKLFMHSEESFRNMWKLVGDKAGETWLVKTNVMPLPENYLSEQKWLPTGTTMLGFTVIRE